MQGKTMFRRTLTLADFDDITLQLVANQWITAFQYEVGAQQILRAGQGAMQNGVDDRGILYVDLQTVAPADITGWVRLYLTDANQVNKQVLMEERTERLSASAVDRAQAYFLGERTDIQIKENSLLGIEVMGDAAVLINVAASEAFIPCTIYF